MTELAVRPGAAARGKTAPAVPRAERGARLQKKVPNAQGEKTGRGPPGLPKGTKLDVGMRVTRGRTAHPGGAPTEDPAVPGSLLHPKGGRDSAARVPTALREKTGRGPTGLPKGRKLGAGRRVTRGRIAHPADAPKGDPAVPVTGRMRGGSGRRTLLSVRMRREGSALRVPGTPGINFLADQGNNRVPEMKKEIAGVDMTALPVPKDGRRGDPAVPRTGRMRGGSG